MAAAPAQMNRFNDTCDGGEAQPAFIVHPVAYTRGQRRIAAPAPNPGRAHGEGKLWQ